MRRTVVFVSLRVRPSSIWGQSMVWPFLLVWGWLTGRLPCACMIRAVGP
ncbi:hypothetical protein GLS_c02340 [Gluconobacter oxydans DSM 3504]|uniref:Uncharacterized protein n=1 Tax=Gluconobacter oxydans DSM 3504 TaxID=1288313 RepID=A0A067Z295_GLUOY|nr:hypothetical protein GLS_c02340 [Gluconobacter oxydans DSM 3504]